MMQKILQLSLIIILIKMPVIGASQITTQSSSPINANPELINYLKYDENLTQDEIRNPATIDSLTLEERWTRKIPDSFSELENLKYLALHFKEMMKDCSALSSLHNLEEINISVNKQMDDIYIHLSKLPKLKKITAAFAKMPLTGIENCSNLIELDISSNNYETFPDEILKLKMLRNLDLSANNLDSIPTEIKSLIKIESLDLSSNNLQDLPEEIGKLNRLRELNLENNKLIDINFKIENLKSIRKLVLTNNPMTEETIQKIKARLPSCQIIF